jgi:hypothetical protein
MVTVKELEAQVASLTAINANLVAAQPKPREVSVKLGEKGGIVVSGLSGRFPTTLYRTSWQRLLTKDVASLIINFIQDNEAEVTKVMIANGKHDAITDKQG